MSRSTVDGGGEKGLLWKLPEVKLKDLGKLGPGIGFGAGCGVGLGIGLFGGAGLGAGFPGLQFGFGISAGCGIGLGFGYGVGKGVAYDDKKNYSNVGKLFQDAVNLRSQYIVRSKHPFVERYLNSAIGIIRSSVANSTAFKIIAEQLKKERLE